MRTLDSNNSGSFQNLGEDQIYYEIRFFVNDNIDELATITTGIYSEDNSAEYQNIQEYISPSNGIEAILYTWVIAGEQCIQDEFLIGEPRNDVFAVINVNNLVIEIWLSGTENFATYDSLKAIIDAYAL